MHAPLKIDLFGPMQVWVDGQSMGTVRSRKAHWLLALLALRNGRPVSREWIAHRLWPDSDDSIALSNLRPILSELRSSLGAQSHRIGSPNRTHLVLDLSDAIVDAIQFDQAIDRQDFEGAIAVYTGPLLEGCSEEWVQQERSQREEACAGAYEFLAHAAHEAQVHDRAIDLYRRLIALEPWRDSARRGLMQVLAETGDVNEALQIYREFASYLAAESGSTPDSQTTTLYLELRNTIRERAKSPPAPAVKIKGNLPIPVSSLIGLEDERREVSNRLRQHRMVTLTGFGGIGKTRLAREVALEVSREFPDGVNLVALDAVLDDRLTRHQILSALSIADTPGKSPLSSLSNHFRDQKGLLVLDNCEHLLTECAEICHTLLRECSQLHILATSREPLSIAGEKVWHTTPLSAPDPTHLPGHPATMIRVVGSFDSVQLFIDRAKSVKDDFELSIDNAQRIAEVCNKLEGIPLAIELAAACVKSMTIHQIASRVQEPVSFLSQGTRGNNARHQTLRATIDWSYAFLTDDERSLLTQVANFVGGWNVESLDAICTTSNDPPSAVLTALVDKSLVVFESSGRYRLLESVRQYALAQQGMSLEISKAKFVEYYCQLLKQLVPDASALPRNRSILAAEEGNIRQALLWSRENPELSATGLTIASVWSGYWFTLGRFSEGLSQIQAMLEADTGVHVLERAQALSHAASLANGAGQFQLSLNLQTEALATFRELNDLPGISQSLRFIGDTQDSLGQPEAALTYYYEGLALCQQLGDERGTASCSVLIGSALSNLGDVRSAMQWISSGCEYFIKTNEPMGVSWALNRQGNVYLDNGPEHLAVQYYERALQIDRQMDSYLAGYTMDNLATAYYSSGDLDRARGFAIEGLTAADKHGDNRCRIGLERTLGNIELLAENYELAISHSQSCLRLIKPGNTTLDAIIALGTCVGALLGLNRCLEATELLSGTQACRLSLEINIPPIDLKRLDSLKQQAIDRLSSKEFDEWWEIGSKMSPEDVIKRALNCHLPPVPGTAKH